MVEYYFKKGNVNYFKNYNAHGIWADGMLDQSTFIYAVINGVSFSCISRSLLTLPQKGKGSGLYHAPFISTLFAIHLNNTVGAHEIPSLEFTTTWETSIVANYPPRGALALAIAVASDSFLLKFSP